MSKVICHDRSPFIDYKCPYCSFIMHIHQTQLPPKHQNFELRTFCKGCGEELVLPLPITWTGEGGANA